jgi:hypothetical protein
MFVVVKAREGIMVAARPGHGVFVILILVFLGLLYDYFRVGCLHPILATINNLLKFTVVSTVLVPVPRCDLRG